MHSKSTLFITFLLITIATLVAEPTHRPTRPSTTDDDDLKETKTSEGNDGLGGVFGPGSGFGIPGFGNGFGGPGGYGGGFGGPNGGYGKGGVVRPTVVCKEKGPCYNKQLRCPAKCFSSFSRSGKGYGGGGGGGGCTMDCKKKCIAYC